MTQGAQHKVLCTGDTHRLYYIDGSAPAMPHTGPNIWCTAQCHYRICYEVIDMTNFKKIVLALALAVPMLGVTQAQAAALGGCEVGKAKVEVVGEGEVKVMPDRVRLNYSVSAVKPTADEARREVEKTVTAFSDAFKALKLDDKAFVADSINIFPRYEYNEKLKKQELQGYEARRNVDIKLSDFALIGKINDMAIAAGINQIAGYEYTVSDRKKYELEAAKKAIEDAKIKAKLLADGFGVKVGTPCTLSFQNNGIAVYRNAAPRMMALAAAAPESNVVSTYSVEPTVISTSVHVVLNLEKAVKDKYD